MPKTFSLKLEDFLISDIRRHRNYTLFYNCQYNHAQKHACFKTHDVRTKELLKVICKYKTDIL